MERVAVDRPDARPVESVLVRSDRPAPVVRGVVADRTADGAFATASGPGDVLLVGGGEPAGQSDGGGFGPPPPAVPFAPPGEGGGGARFVAQTGGGAPAAEAPGPPSVVRNTTCAARDALGQAGQVLDPACESANPGQRSVIGAVDGTVDAVDGVLRGAKSR